MGMVGPYKREVQVDWEPQEPSVPKFAPKREAEPKVEPQKEPVRKRERRERVLVPVRRKQRED